MVLNVFEEKPIRNSRLPLSWQSQVALDELSDFLQQNWEQRAAFYDDRQVYSRQQFIGFTGQKGIKTNNYIGTIVFKGHQLNIFPKMFQMCRDENDPSDLDLKHLMHNIVRWIEYCTKIDYPYINISTELDSAEDLRELFITLYVRYVKSALDRGPYFRYEEITEDTHSIKGRFDLIDYLTRKYPNGKPDQFKCTYSTFEFDNLLNRIIKYTCKELLNETSKTNQKIIRHILTRMNDVSDIRCVPHDCDKVRLSKLHKHYSIILSMSKMFLLNKTSTYNVDRSDSFCFLFPTEILFEGFIGGYMQSVLGSRAKVILQASDTTLIEDTIIDDTSYGSAFTLRNDIYVKSVSGKCFVLDTKYKQVDRIENTRESALAVQRQVDMDDLRQIREYAFKRGLTEGYLLYPIYRYEDMLLPQKAQLKGYIVVNDEKHYIDVFVIRVPFVFEDDETVTHEALSRVIEKIYCNRNI